MDCFPSTLRIMARGIIIIIIIIIHTASSYLWLWQKVIQGGLLSLPSLLFQVLKETP
jgi:hypothetical protein